MSKKATKRGLCWWLFIGWWWFPVKWICFSIPTFIIREILKASTAPEDTPKSNTTTPTVNTAPVAKPSQKSPATPCNATVKTYHATGMAHRLENLLSLRVENTDYSKSKKSLIEDGLIGERVWEYEFYPSKVELIPEPDNPYDPNAIKVVVDGKHIAYIKKGSCAHLLKVIREERIENIKCEIGGGNYKYIYEKEDDEWDGNGKPTYELERGSKNYFVWLHITEKA